MKMGKLLIHEKTMLNFLYQDEKKSTLPNKVLYQKLLKSLNLVLLKIKGLPTKVFVAPSIPERARKKANNITKNHTQVNNEDAENI